MTGKALDDLSALFAPKVLAVIGASRDAHKWGHRLLRHTVERGFRGRLYGVNPSAKAGEQVAGAPLVASLAEIGEQIDLIMVAVGRDKVLVTIEQAADLGVRAAVIAASGFGEIGAEGRAAEERIRDLAAHSGMRLLGPNCFGMFSASAGINLTPRRAIPSGSVALASQSGNVAVSLFREAASAGMGFSWCVGVGNQIDIGFGELLAHFADDPHSRAVALYVEGLPPGEGSRFRGGLDACRRAGKPVIVLKAGTSSKGAAAAATHTRSLAADDRVWNAVLAAHGACRVSSTEQMMDALQAAVRMPTLSAGVAVLTDGGGDSVMAVDALTSSGVRLAELAPRTQQRLRELTPPLAPRTAGCNPLTLDTPGGVQDDPMLLPQCVEALSADPAVGAVVIGGVFGGYRAVRDDELQAVARLVELNRGRIPVAVQSAFAESGEEPITALTRGDVPVYPTIQRLAAALATRACDRRRDAEKHAPAPARVASTTPMEILAAGDALELLARYGVEVRARVVDPDEDVGTAAADIGYPVALKIADPKISHKSDVGGVCLGLADAKELAAAAAQLRARFHRSPLLLMPQYPPGFELLVGTVSDPSFGATVVVGRGGIWTEVERDTALCPLPLSDAQVRNALSQLRCYPMLTGGRGQAPLAIDDVVALVLRVGEIALENPGIGLDLNPVIVYPDHVAIADCRVVRPAPR